MKNIRGSIFYQICGIFGCFITPIVVLKYLDSLIADDNYALLFNSITLILITALVLTVLAFFNPIKKKYECDIMADIGYALYIIIICVLFKVMDYLDDQKIIKHFKNDEKYIEQALSKIQKDNQNTDSYDLIKDVCATNQTCFARYIPTALKYNRTKNTLITKDNKTYYIHIKEHCCPNEGIVNGKKCSYETNPGICYIDVKDKTSQKYMRIFLHREEYRKELNLPSSNYYLYSKELFKNSKRIRWIK